MCRVQVSCFFVHCFFLPPVQLYLILHQSIDAIDVMFQHRAVDKRFDIIDIDPYGECDAVPLQQSVIDEGGLLAQGHLACSWIVQCKQ
jgi:hypothetical protein